MIFSTTPCARLVHAAHALLYKDDMRKLLSVALCLPLAACIIGEEGQPAPDEDPGPSSDGTLGGLITADATWAGTVRIKGFTATIEPNVTVTVAPGTTIQFIGGANLTIKGTLKIQGTSASKIFLQAEDMRYFGGLKVASTGALEMAYAVMKGGSVVTNGAGATATITDTKLFDTSGDLLIMTGGKVTMSYSQIGGDPEEIDGTHCNIHTGGDANTIEITRSNIKGVPFGMMLYGGQNAVLTNNNWFENAIDIETNPGVTGDVSGSWFDEAPPVAGAGATLTANTLAADRLIDAGIRP